MRVRVLLQEGERTVARAVVGLVPLGRYYPVPAVLVKVHSQRVAAAARLLRVLVAVEPEGPSAAVLSAVYRADFHEWLLKHTSKLHTVNHFSKIEGKILSGFCQIFNFNLSCVNVFRRCDSKSSVYSDSFFSVSMGYLL